MSLFEAFSLLGGVGLFLYGMTVMSSGLKDAAGDNLRVILEHATKNRFISILVGIAITVLIQSSSATDVMVIGFVNSGLMTLGQAIGIIMGANIGTTITAQITAFNLSAYAPLILFAGAVMYLFLKSNLVKSIGSVIMGFGMLFEGIALMKTAIAPLSESATFVNFLTTLSNPVLAILFGVAFTALVQSSSSSIVIFQAFAVQGLISFDIAIYLVIGAAIGSVTPNILASLTANRNGKRSAILNLLFNLIRAALLLSLITVFPQILDLIQSLSPNNVGRQIANAHTIFAIVSVAIEAPFANLIVRLAQKIIPLTKAESEGVEERKLVYMSHVLNDRMPSAIAISEAKNEIMRMGLFARNSLQDAFDCFFQRDDELVERVMRQEDNIDELNRAITEKLIEYQTLRLSARDLKKISMMTLVVADIERISDHAKEFAVYETHLRSNRAVISEAGLNDLKHMAEETMKSIDQCLDIFKTEDFSQIKAAHDFHHKIDALEEQCTQNHLERLLHSQCDPMGGVIYTDMVTSMERCSAHAINIACALSDTPS